VNRPWALVTGASSGIGQGIAIRLAKDGFNVIVNHFRQPEQADQTLQSVRAAGSDGISIDADVGDSSEVSSMFRQIAEQALTLAVLVNNAGVQTWASFLELAEEDFDRTIRTNLKGTFLCTQQAARLMQFNSRGSIINIGSGANQIPFPNLVDYCASKGGIEMLTRVAAIELGKLGIRVNCVAPGAIENERTRRESPGYAETWSGVTPLGRCGTIDDVAKAVAYLAGDESSFVTGQTIFVDGGLWTRGVWPYDQD
jgi:NAD(P)-dependent dehydrogenase (short-subunit alcohol dehydrogenase family)